MTRTLGSPTIIQPASHHSRKVYHMPLTTLGSPGIQVCGSLCTQAIFSAFAWRKLEDYSGKDEIRSQLPCGSKEMMDWESGPRMKTFSTQVGSPAWKNRSGLPQTLASYFLNCFSPFARQSCQVTFPTLPCKWVYENSCPSVLVHSRQYSPN